MNYKKPALTRVQKPTPAMFYDSRPRPLIFWPQINFFPRLIVEPLYVKFAYLSCIDVWDIVSQNRQTHGGKTVPPPRNWRRRTDNKLVSLAEHVIMYGLTIQVLHILQVHSLWSTSIFRVNIAGCEMLIQTTTNCRAQQLCLASVGDSVGKRNWLWSNCNARLQSLAPIYRFINDSHRSPICRYS